MEVDLDRLQPQPAGFGRCGQCAYRDVGSAAICFACASRLLDPLPDPRCPVCEQGLEESGECPNWVCRFDDRYFTSVWAVSMLTGALREAIIAYKYNNRWGWAAIFGRVVVGFLDSRADEFGEYNLIIASPTYIGPGAQRQWGHTERILEAAVIEAGDRWPFDYRDPRAIIQTAETERFVGKNWRQRKAIAEGPLRAALVVPEPDKVAGKRILVFDDVFTEGFRIREVARALIHAGARDVSEIVLARQPAEWT